MICGFFLVIAAVCQAAFATALNKPQAAKRTDVDAELEPLTQP
jgi:hypothetical protein